MDAFLEGLLNDEVDFVPAVVAGKAIAQLREQEPEVLNDWLHDNAERFLTTELTYRLRRDRGVVRRGASKRAFAAAAGRAEEGDDEALRHFSVVYEIAPDHTRRRLADMTGADHAFVATRYGERSATNHLLEAFHRVVSRKVANRRTADVFTEEEYGTYLENFFKRNQPQPSTESA